MRAGFIGLGHLGKAIAGRLIAEGVELTVWNRTASKAEGLKARIAVSPAEVYADCKVIFVNLFDSEAVNEVLTGPGGFVEADAEPGRIVIDTSTNHFASVEYFHDMLEELGSSYLEAPVLGSVVPASRGELAVLASGRRAAYDEAKPFIEKMSKKQFYWEERGTATKMKLINNLILGVFMTALAEGVSMAEGAGVDRALALEVLGSGAGNSMVLNSKRDKLISGDFTNQFSVACIYKDLHYAQDLARSMKRPLFTGSVPKELFGLALAEGLEQKDFSAVFEVVNRMKPKA